ncbi:cytochrome c biogenesis CcdA family protein [Phreatobacter stygius]|uniref:cytochrome c biogenesis CcdA family protein n=1 Tax=Phreatobacter stygius TaxID=1940610 RepID=UPI001FECC9A5|nr:cytochrome c biogenesis protein CcdA [Phreatobacter stygius]
MALDISFAGAFLAGLLSFFSPCVLPLVPAYLCFLAGLSFGELEASSSGAVANRRLLIGRAGAFVLGFATIFILLGATASVFGQALTRWFDGLAVVAGLGLVVIGVHMTGLVRIGVLMREARTEIERRPAGLAGAYGIGLAFGFGWTPCVGPVLAAILMLSAAAETVGQGTLLLGFYAAGMGVPFLLAAAFAGPFLSWIARFRPYLVRAQAATGGILVATGLLIATGQMARVGGLLIELFPVFNQVG